MMAETADLTATYKRGLLVDEGDLVLAQGRLSEIAGVANLQQGLTLRVLTPLGTDPLNVSYGLDISEAFTGSLTRQLTKQVLGLNLIRTVGTDPRVAEVVSVLFDDDPEYLAEHPEASASTAGRRRLALAEVTVQPIAPQVAAPVASGGSGALAAGTGIDPVSLMVDVSW
jgi:hypothetical protein